MTTPTQTPKTNSSAIISLVCGILSWLGVFGLGGILSVIFGHVAKKEIRNTAGAQEGNGMATAGLVLGYLNLAMSLIGACLAILVITGSIAIPLFLIPFVD